MKDSPGNFRGERFQAGERAAGGEARFFQERRIQKESATIDEGVNCYLKRFSCAPGRTSLRQDGLIHLQVRLKLQSVACIPPLLAGESREVFLLESSGKFAPRLRGRLCATLRGSFRGNFQSAGGHRQKGLTLQQGQKIAIKCGVHLKTIAAVFDDIGINKARNDALAKQSFSQALCQKSGEIGGVGFGLRVQVGLMVAGVRGYFARGGR